MSDVVDKQPRSQNVTDLTLALLITLVMAALSWMLAGAPGISGIDDAAITRSYSDNIANGHGFVYNIGGERVEGATSLLWTMIVVVPYLFDDNPEVPILAITGGFTALAVFLGLRVTRRALADQYPQIGTILMALALIGLPAYFIWSVWSMMEIAVWSALLMLTLDRLSSLAEKISQHPKFDIMLLVAAIGMPLTRPEGIALFVGLCGLTFLLRPSLWRPLALSSAAALVTFGLIVVFRMAYFGFPLPNTYYAKVSSDRLQNVLDGTKYLASFTTEQPFGGLILASWIILAATSVVALISRRASFGTRTQLLAAALVLGILTLYVALGGDHFAMWRFYQPIMPVILMPLVLGAVAILRLVSEAGASHASATAMFGGLALALWIAINSLSYYQARFDVAKEYELSQRGEAFGSLINTFEPRPVIGVAAAGGVALTYDGPLRDLLGLNWVEMAHANPIKVGIRNHASFDVDTFWKHSPELVPLFNRPTCQREGWTERVSAGETGVKKLFNQTRFQSEYTPILLEGEDGTCSNAFALNSWLRQASDARITVKEWDELSFVTN